jgi:hypothetical protein
MNLREKVATDPQRLLLFLLIRFFRKASALSAVRLNGFGHWKARKAHNFNVDQSAPNYLQV